MGVFKITPFLGPLFNSMYQSPLISNVIFCITAYISYLSTNMINNTPTLVKFCKKRKSKTFLILGVVTLILNIIKIVLVPSGDSEDMDEEE